MEKLRFVFLATALTALVMQSGAQVAEIIIANWEDIVPSTGPGPGVWQYFTPNGTSEIIQNPVPDEINSTENVLAYYRPAGEWLLTGFYYQDGIPVTRNFTGIKFKIYGDSLFKCYAKLIGIVDGVGDQTIYENGWPWSAPDGPGKWNTITLPVDADAFPGDTLTHILIFPNPQEPEASMDTFYIDEVKFLVTVHVDSIKLNVDSAILDAGQNIYLEASVFPENASNLNFTWKSSNTEIATVSSIGKVQAVNPGDADIIVTTEDGGRTDTCHVVVNSPEGITNTNEGIIRIYPNPYNKGELLINLPGPADSDLNLTFFDLQGKILYSYSVNQPGNTIRLIPDLQNGMYILKVKSGTNTWYARFIKY